jgi:hypothetical protein
LNKPLSVCFQLTLAAEALVGCTDPTAHNADGAIKVHGQLCQSKMDFTSSVVGPYTIKIFEPNDSKNPDIWQGPVCIQSETKAVECGFELSLIKSVKPAVDLISIDIVVFSGSNSRTARIALANCEIKFLD